MKHALIKNLFLFIHSNGEARNIQLEETDEVIVIEAEKSPVTDIAEIAHDVIPEEAPKTTIACDQLIDEAEFQRILETMNDGVEEELDEKTAQSEMLKLYDE